MTTTARSSAARAGTRTAAAVAACLALALAAAPAAAADPFSDGQWYAANFHLADNHTIADGAGVTIAMLDGPVDPSVPALAGSKIQPAATSMCVAPDGASSSTADGFAADHATAMATMLVGQGNGNAVGVAPGATLLTYNIGYTDAPGTSTAFSCRDSVGGSDITDTAMARAIEDAVNRGARVVSMSVTTPGNMGALQTAILFAMRKGVVFVASTDDNSPVGDRFNQPASFNGVVAVNGIDSSGKQLDVSASGDPEGPLVVASAPGGGVSLGGFGTDNAYDPAQLSNGSSPATAFVAGALAVTLSKYPQATGNQLIQSLARNTGGQQHDIETRALDGYGYGTVSLTSMLEHDPADYPDENPTLRDGAQPSTSEILQGAGAGSGTPSGTSSSPAASGSTAPSPSSSPVAAADDGSSTGLFIGIGIAVLVLVVVAVLVAVLIARRRRGGAPPPGPGSFPPVATGGYR